MAFCEFYFDGIGQSIFENGLFVLGVFWLWMLSRDLHLRRRRTMSRRRCFTLVWALGELLRENKDDFLLGKAAQDETGSNSYGSRVEDDNPARHVCLRGWTTLFRGVDGAGRSVRDDVSSKQARGAGSFDSDSENMKLL